MRGDALGDASTFAKQKYWSLDFAILQSLQTQHFCEIEKLMWEGEPNKILKCDPANLHLQ